MLITLLLGVATVTPAQAHMGERKAHRLMWQWYRNSGAKCVHTYEGSWTALNPAGPYYGGFQMSIWFQGRFAPHRLTRLGTATHWSPYIQTVVTHKVVTGRNRFFRKRWHAYGWGQWPNTAAMCGLL